MELIAGDKELEALNAQLDDPNQLQAYKTPHDNYHPLFLPRLLGRVLVGCGNLVYGHEPSYLKFRSIEIVARVPYQSWSSAVYTLLTMFYADEHKAIRFSNVSRYARIAQDNETMHVVVISQLARTEGRAGLIRHTLLPMFFAFFYFWASYILYLMRPRWSFELNYLFEQHAFDQYNRFLEQYREELKKKPAESEFLTWYGRNPRSQFEFFQSVRNDELIHRNQSVRAVNTEADAYRVHSLKFVAIGAVIVLLVLILI